MLEAIYEFIRGIFVMDYRKDEAISLLNHEKAARRLRIRKQAMAMGKRNLPAPDDSAPSHLDKAIKSSYAQEMIKNRAMLLHKISSYRDALLKQVNFKDLVAIRALPERYAGEVETRRNSNRAELKRVTGELEWAELELQKFREKNGLDPRAIPEKAAGSYTWLNWLVPAAGDFLINLFLFARVLSGLTGSGVCFVIAFANSVLPFWMGRNLRRFKLASAPNKTAGALSVLMLILVMPLNLLFAHVRDIAASLNHEAASMSYTQLIAGRAAVLQDAMDSFVHHPLSGISNMEAMILLIFGLLAALWSVCAGWKTSEKYPGFSRIFKRFVDLDEKAVAIREDMRLYAARLKTGYETRLEQMVRDERNRIKATMEIFASFISMTDSELKKYELLQRDCASGYGYCIQLARTENLMHRTDGRRPLSFNYPASKIELPGLDFSTEQEVNRLKELEGILDTLDDEKARIDSLLQEACKKEMQEKSTEHGEDEAGKIHGRAVTASSGTGNFTDMKLVCQGR